jgi:hypothetical protein
MSSDRIPKRRRDAIEGIERLVRLYEDRARSPEKSLRQRASTLRCDAKTISRDLKKLALPQAELECILHGMPSQPFLDRAKSGMARKQRILAAVVPLLFILMDRQAVQEDDLRLSEADQEQLLRMVRELDKTNRLEWREPPAGVISIVEALRPPELTRSQLGRGEMYRVVAWFEEWFAAILPILCEDSHTLYLVIHRAYNIVYKEHPKYHPMPKEWWDKHFPKLGKHGPRQSKPRVLPRLHSA